MVRGARATLAILSRLAFAVAALALFPRTAHAYVDPTSGSLVLQIVAAGVLGAVLTIKQWWSKATSLFRALFTRGKST
jgi:hypothetical protein